MVNENTLKLRASRGFDDSSQQRMIALVKDEKGIQTDAPKKATPKRVCPDMGFKAYSTVEEENLHSKPRWQYWRRWRFWSFGMSEHEKVNSFFLETLNKERNQSSYQKARTRWRLRCWEQRWWGILSLFHFVSDSISSQSLTRFPQLTIVATTKETKSCKEFAKTNTIPTKRETPNHTKTFLTRKAISNTTKEISCNVHNW